MMVSLPGSVLAWTAGDQMMNELQRVRERGILRETGTTR